MAIISFKSDSTTLILNGQVISDLITGDILELAPSNNDTARVYGANHAVNVQKSAVADVYTLKFRVMKNSDSDIFLNTQLNLPTPVIFEGSIKERFMKNGTEAVENFKLSSGSFITRPTHSKNNVDGNGQVEYTIECFASRMI